MIMWKCEHIIKPLVVYNIRLKYSNMDSLNPQEAIRNNRNSKHNDTK